MIKYFELLLDLLDIEESSRAGYITIANIIESKKYSNIKCYHRYGFIFQWYKNLLDEDMTIDEFTNLGDFKSKIFADTKKQDSISYLRSDPVLDESILYVFDKISEGIVSNSENIFYV